QCFRTFVERLSHALDDEVWHAGVDFARELDKARVKIELPRLPGKIERIDGDAVAAKARPGIKRMESERLAFGGLNDLEDVEAHPDAELLELIDQRNVHAAVDILKQLCHLRHGRRGDRHSPGEDRTVQSRGDLRGSRTDTADHLGNV